MADTDIFSVVEIMALTAIGESESRGNTGMQQTINTEMNRVTANKGWMGGADPRAVCLQKGQYDCWWPQTNNDDRARIIAIGLNNPTYGPYITALGLAQQALNGTLPDITNGAVSYGDDGDRPAVHPNAQPCLIDGSRELFDLSAVA